LEDLVTRDSSFWTGRSVFVTGHTGFKGGWLIVWLHQLGAEVHGYALDPPTVPSLFEVARIRPLLSSDTRADLADFACLRSAMRDAQPEVVFHLAAQPLVRESYRDPLGTFTTNTLGTARVLEAARASDGVRAVVLVATDKVYADLGSDLPFRESDPLGGQDPYSASKAAAELVAASYRSSFFSGDAGHSARVATARSGNVIGGGDWASDRLIPDCLRAFEAGRPARLRHPDSVRPWQHVLEPLSGYLRLAERLEAADGEAYATSWNFGPDSSDEATVAQVADLVAAGWGDGAIVEHAITSDGPHETRVLKLDTSRARTALRWAPRWPLTEAVRWTVSWHRAWSSGADMLSICRSQIDAYQKRDGS
jgi:CDP-glucose 4,6-dehydratase